MEENNFKIENQEFIKLMKMSKGYQWEIKIVPIPIREMDDKGEWCKDKVSRLEEYDLDRLQKFDTELRRRFDNREQCKEVTE